MNPNNQNGNNNSFGPNPNQPNPQTQQNQDPNMQAFINQAERNAIAQDPHAFSDPTPMPKTTLDAPEFSAPMLPQQPQMAQPIQPMQTTRPQPMMPAPRPNVTPAQEKKSHVLEIALIVFIFLIGAGAIAGAAYCQSQFSTLNANVMTDRSKRVDDAKAAQKILDDQAYENRNASNTKEFTGPSDFGAITFKYPKSWKVYLENNDDSNPTYTAYFSPEYVPPTNGNYSFALSFKIVNQEYNKYLQTLGQRKLISTQPWNNPNNTLTGSKITGKLDEKAEQPNGSEIVIRVNNYTAIVRTDDYDKYGEDYDEILATLDSANSANSTKSAKGTSDTNDTDQ